MDRICSRKCYLVKQFEEETGIQVNMSTFSSNEDMLAKVKSETEGAYDIGTAK
jgi:spermidine/putrescine transport system permease protein